MRFTFRGLAAASALALTMTAVTACSAAEGSAPDTSSASNGQIAVGMPSLGIQVLNDVVAEMEPLVQAAGYSLVTSDPNFNVTTQVNDWSTWANSPDIKAIVGYPLSKESMVPVTETALANKIPVVGYLETWDGVDAAVLVDGYGGGEELGRITATAIAETEGADAEITVAAVGDRSIPLTSTAMDGIRAGVEAVLPNATVVDVAATTQEEGFTAAQAQLTAEPDTRVWIGASNDYIQGVYQALLAQGVDPADPDYYLASRDATDESLNIILEPDSIWRTSIIVPASSIAAALAELAIAAAEGETVESLTVESIVVDASNAAEFLSE